MNTAALPAYMTAPIRDEKGADQFTRALHAAGKLWHYDDTPSDIVEDSTGERSFTDAECGALEQRVAEMASLDGYDPFELCVFLTNTPDSFIALDDEAIRLYGEGLYVEQRALLGRMQDCPTTEEIEEADGMLADMEARMGFRSEVCAAALAEIKTLSSAVAQ